MTVPASSEPSALEIRRRRALFRSWHRGTREADLMLGRFADRHAPGWGREELAAWERLLEQNDPDLYDWVTGRATPPAELDGPVLRRLIAEVAAGTGHSTGGSAA